jgi:hypothetical protein
MKNVFFRHYSQEIGFIPASQRDRLYRLDIDPFQTQDEQALLSYFVRGEPGVSCGHHVIESNEFAQLAGGNVYVPVSPLFARDLAGRVVYLGAGPERKNNVGEWDAYTIDLNDAEQVLTVPTVVFPAGCRSVVEMADAELLESVFLTRFRCLEIGLSAGEPSSGGVSPEVGVYEGANLYPYKLRLDTFYIDGFRLPQTQMVFARGASEGVSPVKGLNLGEAMLTAWGARPQGQSWQDFTAAQGGEDWLEKLFREGCTVIPTFEACNGYHVVGRNFELEDYWPGRAVLGLHEPVGSKPSKAPIGTIIEVVEPGFVTAATVRPAKVVISDGSGYVSPHGENPVPLLPNLHLPHPRALSLWGACWLPTHPGHFEAPALWGWDQLDTGRFVQLSGPLWDPLHYYYASVDEVLKAHERPPAAEGIAAGLVAVPETMHNRFYPVALPDGFDSFSMHEKARRQDKRLRPDTAIVRRRTGKPGAGLGYHPLPLEYEVELEPFWLPDTHPINRGHGLCPEELMPRLAPVIAPQVGVENYKQSLEVPEEATWFAADGLLLAPSEDGLQNYPHLARYIAPDLPMEGVLTLATPPYLAEPRRGLLTATPQELWDGIDGYEDLEAIAPGLYDAVWDAKEEALTLMRYRHYVYRGKKLLYMLAWWYGLDADELTMLEKEDSDAEQAAQVKQAANTRVGQVSRAMQQAPEAPAKPRWTAQTGAPVVRGK